MRSVIYICLAITLIYLSKTDIKELILPDKGILVLFVCGLLLNGFCLQNFAAALCILLLWLLAFLICRILKTGIPYGFGDCKLLMAVSAGFGGNICITCFAYASVMAGIAAALLLISGKKNKKDQIAFGPFICFAFIFACFANAC